LVGIFAIPAKSCFTLWKNEFVSQMGTQFKCPKCGSPVYSRQHPVCGRCGGKLPKSLMFNPVVRKKVEEMIEQDKKREQWGNKFPGHDTGSSGIIGGI
jgi:ribosomal protein L37E